MGGVAHRLIAEVGADGIGRLSLARFAHIGHLEVDPEIVGTTLTLRLRKLVVLGRWLRVPRWIPRYNVALPAPHGLFITDIELHSESVSISATLPEWTIELPRTRVDDIFAQLRPGNRLKLTGSQPFFRKR
jgi:hypothetical protein